jgi:hypothetical protein
VWENETPPQKRYQNDFINKGNHEAGKRKRAQALLRAHDGKRA